MKFRYLISIFLLLFFSDICAAQSSDSKQLLKRARGGDVAAMRILGKKLVQGKGVKRDVTNGVKWLKMAAERGDSGALLLMGDLHRSGTGVPKNINTAITYYQQAAKAGNTTAKDRLKKYAPETQTSEKQPEPTKETSKPSAETEAKETAAPDAKQEVSQQKQQPTPTVNYPPVVLEFQDAVRRREYWKYEEYIAKGVDINLPFLNSKGTPDKYYTALHCAVLKQDYEGAKILIKRGANINQRYSQGDRIWVYVLRDKHVTDHSKRCEFIFWLLDNNIILEPSIAGKETLMHVAVMCGNYEVISHLLKLGDKIDVPREGGITPLTDVTIWLMQAIGSAVESPGHRNASLIPHIEDKINMLSELLKAGANPNIPGTYNFNVKKLSTRTAFTHTVLRAGNYKNSKYYYEVCNLLTRYGADPHQKNQDGLNALEELILYHADYDVKPGIIARGTCRELIQCFINDNVIISDSKALERLKEDGELHYLYKQQHPEAQ